MNSSDNFKESLARGVAFEEIASTWIKTNFVSWWVTDCRLHKFKGKGPRMVWNGQELVLPDFRLDHISEPQSMWIDAKLKKQPARLPNNSNVYFSLDPTQYAHYQNLMQALPHMPFWILLGQENTRQLYIFKLKPEPDAWHTYNNQYVRNQNGKTPMFNLANMEKLDKF